jgi:DNA repair photolyase
VYCYAAAYSSPRPAPKGKFERLLAKDLEDLERFDVPPAPVHLSNSTDPFQKLERQHGHTRFALEQILKARHRFTTITILTKDPFWPTTAGYIDLFSELAELAESHPRHTEFSASGTPAFCVEVSLAFWRQEAASAYDPCAPSVEERMEGVRRLRAAGIPVVLRIDPLFPRSPVVGGSLADYGLTEAQPMEDLEELVRFAKEMTVRHVVYSPVKIVQPRGRAVSPVMRQWRLVYERMAAPSRLIFRGGSWRLPPELAENSIVQPFLALCASYGVRAKHCMRNLIETP